MRMGNGLKSRGSGRQYEQLSVSMRKSPTCLGQLTGAILYCCRGVHGNGILFPFRYVSMTLIPIPRFPTSAIRLPVHMNASTVTLQYLHPWPSVARNKCLTITVQSACKWDPKTAFVALLWFFTPSDLLFVPGLFVDMGQVKRCPTHTHIGLQLILKYLSKQQA